MPKKLLFFLVFCFLIGPEKGLAYKPETTHAALSDEIADFYNLLHPENVITAQEKEWIIEGSILEDTPPRWINHFYDPIQKIGWDGRKFGRADPLFARALTFLAIPERVLSAKEWVNSFLVQESYSRYQGDRTWGQALNYYAYGNKEEAFRTLGFSLHLLEDMAVPEHTRNDPHPHSLEALTGETGSPYEEYADRWNKETFQIAEKLKNENLSAIQKSSIEEYIESLAQYSNKYFFSKDTINDPDYQNPKIVREDKKLGYGIDSEKQEFPLVLISEVWNKDLKEYKRSYILEKNEPAYHPIFDSYFSRLSKQTVLHGAGVIELFKKQGEEAVVNKDFPVRLVKFDTSRLSLPMISIFGESARFAGAAKKFFANLGNAISGIFQIAFSDRRELAEVVELNKDDRIRNQTGSAGQSGEASELEIKLCDPKTANRTKTSPLILSEVAWMGRLNQPESEWIEIYNFSQDPVDVSGFQLLDETGDIKIIFPKGTKIPGQSFYVLERSSENSAPETAADFIYSGGLRNTNEGLRFFGADCALLDEAVADPNWPAGENAAKKTMERNFSNLSWQTSAIVHGTAKKPNSSPAEVRPETLVSESPESAEAAEEAEDDESAENKTESEGNPAKSETKTTNPETATEKNSSPASFCRFNPNQNAVRGPIIFNEIAWMGLPENSADEWIELKNRDSKAVDISGWQVLDKDEQIKIVFPADSVIPGLGLYLLERTDDGSAPGVKTDLIYKGALSNSDEGLQIFNKECVLIDEALANPYWKAGSAEGKNTMERTDYLEWQTSANRGGTPKSENSKIVSGGSGVPPGGSSQNSDSNQNADSGTGALETKLIISEIMYDLPGSDDNREWLEIYNAGESATDLSLWKLFENSVNHGIILFSGPNLIQAGGYAVIADNPDRFLEDYPNYSGSLFDSSFSLSNTGEILKILKDNIAADEVNYSSAWGGQGDGNSLQYLNNSWQAAAPTPGAANVQPVVNLPETASSSLTARIVISEVQLAGADAGDEFIELYNPGDSAISLAGWSIQYLSGGATSTAKAVKKNFESGSKIPGRGFFLIGRGKDQNGADGYTGSRKADLTHRSFSMSSTENGAVIILTSTTELVSGLDDDSISDVLAYGNPSLTGVSTSSLPQAGESLERKSAMENNCFSARGDYEFSGNGCDRNLGSDFTIRTSPGPQNTTALPEPREAPSKPGPPSGADSVLTYNSSTLELVFSWAPSFDALGASSSLIYEIEEIASSSRTVVFKAVSASLIFRKSIDEIGRRYDFSIRAIDEDGLGSASSSLSVVTPSFLKTLYFYRSPQNNSDYLIDFSYENYPFIPDIYRNFVNDTWKAVVFYLNREPGKSMFLELASNWTPADTEKLVRVKYDRCAGAGSHPGASLLLPDTNDRCSNAGGLNNYSLPHYLLEDKNLIIKAASSSGVLDLAANDYLTAGFYSFFQSGGGEQIFKLAAVDSAKYYFQTEKPAHLPPSAPQNISFVFDELNSEITASWIGSTDPDTMDFLISYEFNYSTSSVFDDALWQSAGSNTNFVFRPAFNNSYFFAVRAVDDFGNVSEAASSSWNFPAGYIPLPSQLNHSSQISTVGIESMLGQKFFIESDIVIDQAGLWIGNPGGVFCCAETHLKIFRDENGGFGEFLAESSASRTSPNEPEQEQIYNFSAGVELQKGKFYWLAPVLGPTILNSAIIYGAENSSYTDGFWSENSFRDAYFKFRQKID